MSISLTPTLHHTSVREAADDLARLHADYGVVPADPDGAIAETLSSVLQEVGDLSVYDLVVEHRTHLARLAGVPTVDLTRFQATAEAEPTHRYRNVMAALCLAAAIAIDQADPVPVLESFVTLKQRTRMSHRAYVADEILLLRLFAHHLSTRDARNHRTAAIYAQVDAGLACSETQQTTPADIVTEHREGLISAAGNGQLRPRDIVMDHYCTTALQGFINRTTPAQGELLTYRPRKAERADPNASASAHQAVDRIRRAVGLTSTDTKASSIAMWRIENTLHERGAHEALNVSGRSSQANLREVLWHGTRRQASPAARNRRRMSMLSPIA